MKHFITRNRTVSGLLIAAFWLLIWQLIALAINSSLILPSPLTTLKTLAQMVVTAKFWHSVAVSLLRITAGFLLALLCGSLLAAITGKSPLCRRLLAPILHIIKATPVASFIIITLIWLPNNSIPIWISFLMVLPIIWTNVEKGIFSLQKDYLEMAKCFRLSSIMKLKKIIIPSVMPYFMAGAITSMGMAWKAGVAAEVLCTPKWAIGSGLYDAKIYLEIPQLFAWTTTVICLSIILERLFVFLMKKAGKRYNVSEVSK